ncbi:MAG: hypothetical protein GX492_03465 [Firmicutes bacterium]|nr:hypothetical protein [Bacillota bacterium]
MEPEVPHPKVLQMVVKIQWTVDNLRTLGAGSMYHLAYRPCEISYDVLVDINSGRIGPGTRAEVIFIGGHRPVKVADVVIENVIASKGFRRFDFRIVRTLPHVEKCTGYTNIGILCLYSPPH